MTRFEPFRAERKQTQRLAICSKQTSESSQAKEKGCGDGYVQRCVIKVARSFRHRPTKGTSAFIPGMGMEELQPNALRSS
jgi:hypothetical protein